MRFRKALATTLIFLLLIWTTGYADQPTQATSTPETDLLVSLIALSGQNLAAQQIQESLSTDFQQYEATAPAQGRMERMERGLVALGISTPAQAQALEAQAQQAIERLSQSRFDSAQDAQKAFQAQLLSIVSTSSSGAQFSIAYCAGTWGLQLLGIAMNVWAAWWLWQNGSSDSNGNSWAEDYEFVGVCFTILAGLFIYFEAAGSSGNCGAIWLP